MIITAIAFAFGIYVNLTKFKPGDIQNKYKCFTPWKWWIITYELAMISEFIITPFFWIFLRSKALKKE